MGRDPQIVDGAAAEMWKEHYLAALEIDAAKMNLAGLAAARKRWRGEVLADPGGAVLDVRPGVAL